MDHKRERLNYMWLFLGELKDSEIPYDERAQLLGMQRVKTWKPNAGEFARTPSLILLGFFSFIFILAQLWYVLLVVPVVCAAVWLILYLNSPTYCAKCKREMDYHRPTVSGIKYDWCKSCKCYCNVRWVPEGDG